MALTQEEGAELVHMARRSVVALVRGQRTMGEDDLDNAPPYLQEERGVFVTLKTLDGGLRGCIGYPYPVMPLGEAVVEAAVSAASRDPRFPEVTADELDAILVEVSALTRPEPIEYSSPKELPKLIRIGKDGLIVSSRGASGLLLPQVATEHGMSPEDFLSNTCLKAGLMPDAWLTGDTKVQRFQAEIFSETSPSGDVTREPEE
jgi:uncharacterized protein